jgi:hypothetical protein
VNVRYWGQSGDHADMRSCLLLTQSGHAACAGECLSTDGNRRNTVLSSNFTPRLFSTA